MTTIYLKVSDSLSANQNLLIDYENVKANELFSKWIPIESEDHLGVSVAESIMKNEILINEQQNYVKEEIVLKDNDTFLSEGFWNIVESCKIS